MMQRQGVVPDVITCSALISACEKGTNQPPGPTAPPRQHRQDLQHESIKPVFNTCRAACGRNTIDEMVLRDAILTDGLIPLETMNGAWGQGNVFLAYKQSHAIMEYIAEHYGPEKISRILRLWDMQNDTDKLLDRLIGMEMKTLDLSLIHI